MTTCRLLTCGTQEADSAYKQLFTLIGLEAIEAPTIDKLPLAAIAGFDRDYFALAMSAAWLQGQHTLVL